MGGQLSRRPRYALIRVSPRHPAHQSPVCTAAPVCTAVPNARVPIPVHATLPGACVPHSAPCVHHNAS
eukprot:8013590-Pyramimonas_sp.AAC.1